MKGLILTLVMLMAVPPTVARASLQRAVTPEEERAAWVQAARAIPSGSTVRVELRSGRRITGTLVFVTPDGLLIKERSQRERPALLVALDEVTRVERVQKGTMNVAKIVGAGAAAGAGAFLAFLAFALMAFD